MAAEDRDEMRISNPTPRPNATTTIIAIIAAFTGPAAVAVIVSDIEPSIKAWLGAGYIVLIIVLALVALGKHESFVRSWKEGNFELRIRDHPQHVNRLILITGRVKQTLVSFDNLMGLLRKQFATFETFPNSEQRSILSPALLHAATINIFDGWNRTEEAVESLRPRRYNLTKTRELYHALGHLIGVVDGIGAVLEGLVKDIHSAKDVKPSVRTIHAFEKFRQEYASLTDSVRTHAELTSQLFGREMQFEPRHLLSLQRP